ncbi:MAG TPA: metallophosphoesterase [Thermoplasmata archaeon]|nr:metallophosphoesterase [Thermoplasmata archaeon]
MAASTTEVKDVGRTAVYAIADTHLGLREKGWMRLAKTKWVDRRSDQPGRVVEFLRWLAEIPPQGWDLSVLDETRVIRRTLQRPSHLILLGDVLELWDGENEAILLSSVPVQRALSALGADKVYVLGNHDAVLEPYQAFYPFGVPGLTIVPDSYPDVDDDPVRPRVHPLRIGDRDFLFVHGHQLDLSFRIAVKLHLLGVLGHLRRFGSATGPYALFIFGLMFVIALPFVVLAPTIPGWILLASLFLLAFPRLYMKVARPLYDKLAGKKYRRSRTLRGFSSWWKQFRQTLELTNDLGIVFGHTHYLDWIEIPHETATRRAAQRAERKLTALLRTENRKRQSLYNISSWVSVRGRHEEIVGATIFYADDRGPLILGWDWHSNKPFHIPFTFIEKKRAPGVVEALTSGELATARQLGWPSRLIERWQRERIKL